MSKARMLGRYAQIKPIRPDQRWLRLGKQQGSKPSPRKPQPTGVKKNVRNMP